MIVTTTKAIYLCVTVDGGDEVESEKAVVQIAVPRVWK